VGRPSRLLVVWAASCALALPACGEAPHEGATAAAVTPLSPLPPETTPVAATPRASPSATAPAALSSAAPPVPSHAPGSPYRAGAHGYDASYPQCASGVPPRRADFSIVGVNGGRAFTANPCLRAQWRVATVRRSVYLNTGLDPRNARRVTAGCRELGRRLDATAERRAAYAIGCSEAVYSRGVMRAAGIREPVPWWLDVELANSWSADVNLNRFALQGALDQLAGAGPLPGVYSTPKDWAAITGGWSTATVAADWVGASTPAAACGTGGFSGAPGWRVQEIAEWPPPSGYDSDLAC
jgi:hypothetical protein